MFSIISKEAGGAELTYRFALKQKEKFCLALSGPAIKIFKKKFNKMKIITNLIGSYVQLVPRVILKKMV